MAHLLHRQVPSRAAGRPGYRPPACRGPTCRACRSSSNRPCRRMRYLPTGCRRRPRCPSRALAAAVRMARHPVEPARPLIRIVGSDVPENQPLPPMATRPTGCRRRRPHRHPDHRPRCTDRLGQPTRPLPGPGAAAEDGDPAQPLPGRRARVLPAPGGLRRSVAASAPIFAARPSPACSWTAR